MTSIILTIVNIVPTFRFDAFVTRFVALTNNQIPQSNANSIIKPPIEIGKGKKDIMVAI